MIYLVIAVAAIVLFWFISTYNFFVSSKARIKASVQEIGNQLKRQAELIPNLEASVKGYLAHEKGILQMLADARKMLATGRDASRKISELLPKLQVVVESNPQLKGADVVTNLMNELRDTSDKVMYARRLLIDLTADFNVKRISFPTNLVANMFKFEEMKGLDTPDTGENLKVTNEDIKRVKIDI